MTEPIAPDPTEPLQYELEYTVGSTFADRLSAVSFRRSVLQCGRIVRMIVLAIAVTAFGYAAGNRDGQTFAIVMAAMSVGVFAVLIFLTYLITFIRGRGHLRKRFPAGAVFSVGFREATMVIRTALASTEVSYAVYRACERDQDFVFLRQVNSRISTILPIQCFTDQSLGWLTEKIIATTNDTA